MQREGTVSETMAVRPSGRACGKKPVVCRRRWCTAMRCSGQPWCLPLSPLVAALYGRWWRLLQQSRHQCSCETILYLWFQVTGFLLCAFSSWFHQHLFIVLFFLLHCPFESARKNCICSGKSRTFHNFFIARFSFRPISYSKWLLVLSLCALIAVEFCSFSHTVSLSFLAKI